MSKLRITILFWILTYWKTEKKEKVWSSKNWNWRKIEKFMAEACWNFQIKWAAQGPLGRQASGRSLVWLVSTQDKFESLYSCVFTKLVINDQLKYLIIFLLKYSIFRKLSATMSRRPRSGDLEDETGAPPPARRPRCEIFFNFQKFYPLPFSDRRQSWKNRRYWTRASQW